MAFCNAQNPEPDELSEDEVFFGKWTLKEVKKNIFFDRHRKSLEYETANFEENSSDLSLKIIETHSDPDKIILDSSSSSPDTSTLGYENSQAYSEITQDIQDTDDSFLKIEKMVTDMRVSANNCDDEEFDNTLEVIDHILNNNPQGKVNKCHSINDKTCGQPASEVVIPQIKITDSLGTMEDQLQPINPITSQQCNMVKEENDNLKLNTQITPVKADVFKTPSSKYKTKMLGLKKTPSKKNTYQHITSPVALYIRNSPQVQLLKDVCPKKPLSSNSSIPRPVKNVTSNKENMNLPSLAYYSAKNTKVVKLEDEEKLPKSEWAKKINSEIPKAVVMRHILREGDLTNNQKQSMQHENSFDHNLSLHQADVSVCTQKTAYRRLNKP